MRFRILRWAGRDRAPFRAGQFGLQCVRNVRRDVAFDLKDVGKLSIISFGPQMRVIHRIDQLHMDSNFVAGLAHIAFENIGHTELFRDVRQVRARAFEPLR